MRDIFQDIFVDQPIDPIEASRRNMRPQLKKRFYKNVSVTRRGADHAIELDGRPVRTPARAVLAAPTLPLARAIAAEWEAQADAVDPATMPLTRLANTVIDGVATRMPEVASEIEKYLASDLVCYRAEGPEALIARQAKAWDPVLAFARDVLGARFVLTQGVVFVAQPDHAIAAARGAIPIDPWRLGAVHAIMTLSGSALIALALARGGLSLDAAETAAHVDEDWNLDQWGRDALAMERRTARLTEMRAAATVLQTVA
jgi:chaperone required for assembly of F1-ATPase